MPLSRVLLGLLSERSSTGYDLARLIETELSPVWRAEISQIYPALDGMRRAGLVLRRSLGSGRGPRRNLYRITAAGRRELRRWIEELPAPPRGKDEGLTRLAFLEAVSVEERRRAILNYDRTLVEEIRRLKASARLPPFRREVRRAAVERLEATRRSLRVLLAVAGTPVAAGNGTRDKPEKKK